MKDSIVTGIPFAGTEISPSPSLIMCETSPLPSSSTTSSDNISLPSSPTHQECATAGMPDQTSESCEENSDEINMTSSSQEDRSAGQADVVPMHSGEDSSSGDAAASRSVNTGYKMVFDELLTKHIPHEHSTEMATKSETVSVI